MDECGGNGTRGGIRTPDAHLRTVALYPLSYAGKSPPVGVILPYREVRLKGTSGAGEQGIQSENSAEKYRCCIQQHEISSLFLRQYHCRCCGFPLWATGWCWRSTGLRRNDPAGQPMSKEVSIAGFVAWWIAQELGFARARLPRQRPFAGLLGHGCLRMVRRGSGRSPW